jgi:hypothetical protein
MFHKKLLFAGKDQFLARPYALGCGLAAIMETSKPAIPGHFSCSVVAFKITVVQLVMEITSINQFLFAHHDTFKTGMCKTGANSLNVEM